MLKNNARLYDIKSTVKLITMILESTEEERRIGVEDITNQGK